MNWPLKVRIIEHFGKQWLFARELGIDDSIVSRVINGAKDLPPEQQKRWAKAMRCQVADIFPDQPGQ